MEVVVTLLLLVVCARNCALEALPSPGQHPRVTSLLDTLSADAQSEEFDGPPRLREARDLSSLAVAHGPVSVVQDWSLVCVQLCGAALGGVPCNPQCTSVTVPVSVRKSNAVILLSPNKDVICEDLCALKLGGDICRCSSFASARSVQDRNQVCRTFCLNNRETLAGCSICNVATPLNEWSTEDKEFVGHAVADTLQDFEAAVAPDSANPATAPSTTPDWDALCVSLCKTGDGGSLCNCDLSPFY